MAAIATLIIENDIPIDFETIKRLLKNKVWDFEKFIVARCQRYICCYFASLSLIIYLNNPNLKFHGFNHEKNYGPFIETNQMLFGETIYSGFILYSH